MTFVIGLKVGDGIVLGADSASTMTKTIDKSYHNSYFNAEKLFNLVKGEPVGLVTCGMGGLAGRSVGWHVKTLREALIDPASPYRIDTQAYTVEEIAKHVREYFYTNLYRTHCTDGPEFPTLGFFIAGYSSGSESGEVWRIYVGNDGVCQDPFCIVPVDVPTQVVWDGQPEACWRLLYGWSPEILLRLEAAGVEREAALQLLNCATPLSHGDMPIQDAIDLVDYFVKVACGYTRFAPGELTVAEPIDTAAITKHEGFRWIHRKHYYPRELNLSHP